MRACFSFEITLVAIQHSISRKKFHPRITRDIDTFTVYFKQFPIILNVDMQGEIINELI